MKKIKIQSLFGNIYLQWAIIFFTISFTGLIFLFGGTEPNIKLIKLIIGGFFTSICFFSSYYKNKKDYVSCLKLYPDFIEVEYKSWFKTIKTDRIEKSDIKSVKIEINSADEDNKHKILKCNITTNITLNNGEIYSFFNNIEPGFFSCSYQYLIDMAKESMNFPGFSYSIQGNSKDLDFIRKDMLFLYTQKRRIPFIKRVFSMKCAVSGADLFIYYIFLWVVIPILAIIVISVLYILFYELNH